MATTVTVLCTNGRRVAVKVSPSTVLLQVLEEACRKQKLDPSIHTLKHAGKALDLNAMFRFTNIPKNAHLEMISANRSQVSSEVLLAVQCEDGSRRQEKFTNPRTTSLWDVLNKVGVVSDAGEQREPVVVYMNTQICGESNLRGKTLQGIGLLSGRAVLRFLYRTVSSSSLTTPTMSTTGGTDSESDSTQRPVAQDQLLVTATDVVMETVTVSNNEEPKCKPQENIKSGNKGKQEDTEYYFPAHPINYFNYQEPQASLPVAAREGLIEPAITSWEQPEPVLQVAPLHEQAHSQRTHPPPTARQYDEPCDRERVVYRLDTPLSVTPTDEVRDDFFKVTHRDVHLMHKDLKKQVAMADTPLLTEAMRQVVKEKRYENYERCVLRVHLPDRWVLQGCFQPRESLKAVVRFVRDNLVDPGLKFYLYTTPPKTVLKSGRPTLTEAGFVPAAILYVGIEGEHLLATPLLSQDCLGCAQSALQAEMVVVGKRGSASALKDPPTLSVKQSSSSDRGSSIEEVSTAIAKTVPKWFKTSK